MQADLSPVSQHRDFLTKPGSCRQDVAIQKHTSLAFCSYMCKMQEHRIPQSGMANSFLEDFVFSKWSGHKGESCNFDCLFLWTQTCEDANATSHVLLFKRPRLKSRVLFRRPRLNSRAFLALESANWRAL